MVEKIDLHIHTSCSDGTINLINEGNSCFAGYDLIAITDHENLFNPREFDFANCKAKFIPGVEICCNYWGAYIEILGYDFESENENLSDIVSYVRNQRILAMDTILKNNNVTDYHIAGNPFRINVQLPYHIDKRKFWKQNEVEYKKIYHSVGAEEVIDAILSAGGIPVLAHPMESLRGYDEESVKKLIGSLGIRNIEFLTPKHTAEEVEMLERIIIYYDLSASIGSDTHKSVLSSIPFEYDLKKRYFMWIQRFL